MSTPFEAAQLGGRACHYLKEAMAFLTLDDPRRRPTRVVTQFDCYREFDRRL